MNNTAVFIVLAFLTGALIPVQAALNASLNRNIGNAVFTAGIVLAMGLISMALVILFTVKQFPSARTIVTAPPYSYLGGVIVATYILLITIITPKLGAGVAIGLIVVGQITSAMLIDHFGWFNIDIRRVDLQRLIGILLMFGGIFLVMKKKS